VFIGHFAASFASKRIAARPSLGWLFEAAQWPDLLWPILCLAGVEHFRVLQGASAFTPLAFDYYPWSHSLVMDLVWGVALGGAYFARSRDRRGALVVAVLVVSHWLLDWITHIPDMPIRPGGVTRVGLGMWRSVPLTLSVETLLFVIGIWLYLRVTTARDRIGSIGFWMLAAFLYLSYIVNTITPPPPSPTVVSLGALSLWILIPIAAWIDRHRVRAPESRTALSE